MFFAGQAFESNGRVSVTVMDGEEMVGRMADQVLILMIITNSALRISFDDISLCNYRVIFKISLKYRYRIFLKISHDINNEVCTVNCLQFASKIKIT